MKAANKVHRTLKLLCLQCSKSRKGIQNSMIEHISIYTCFAVTAAIFISNQIPKNASAGEDVFLAMINYPVTHRNNFLQTAEPNYDLIVQPDAR